MVVPAQRPVNKNVQSASVACKVYVICSVQVVSTSLWYAGRTNIQCSVCKNAQTAREASQISAGCR